jgi:hypothetical protein
LIEVLQQRSCVASVGKQASVSTPNLTSSQVGLGVEKIGSHAEDFKLKLSSRTPRIGININHQPSTINHQSPSHITYSLASVSIVLIS